jgi:D-alanyl-D-alanine carboxypeptidase
VLRLAGGASAVTALGSIGWVGRTAYLTVEGDRTYLGDSSQTGSLVDGPRAQSVPSDTLLAELQAFSDQRRDVGLQGAVVFDDGTRWIGAAGNASHSDQTPLSHDFHLFIGSVTKLVTAALVLHQVQLGSVALTDTIDEWFDFEYADTVTVRMLLNHTSGIPNYTEKPWFLARQAGLPTKQWQPSELVDLIRGDPLNFEPGSTHRYSNTNFVLLGVILKRVTDTRYRDLIRDLVRSELGYDRTYYLDYLDDAPIANAYDESLFGPGRRNLTGFRTSLETGAYAAGGILSTAPNVAGFVRSVFTGRVLSDEMLSEMRSFVDAPDEDVPAQRGYGLGIRHLRIDGEDLYGHTGTIPGYSAIAMYHENPQYTIAVLSNVSTIDQTGIYGTLQDVVLEDFY